MRILGKLCTRLKRAGTLFRRDEQGNVAIITAATMLGIVVMTGGAIDILSFEVKRKKAQAALDRAVLAASSTNQALVTGATPEARRLAAEEIVVAYFESAGLTWPEGASVQLFEDDPNTPEDETGKGIYRKISANGVLPTRTNFLRLIDKDNLDVPVRANAAERDQDVEIAIVLDHSTSMITNNVSIDGTSMTRLDALRSAANDFFDTILANAGSRERTSVSVVPFGASVSVGRKMFAELTGDNNRDHYFSSCYTFDDDEFTTTTTIDGEVKRVNFIPNFRNVDQFSHFGSHQSYTTSYPDYEPHFCPPMYQNMETERHYTSVSALGEGWPNSKEFTGHTEGENTSIEYLQNDAEKLKASLASYKAVASTATHIGMKWGLMLLDPGFRTELQDARSAGAFTSEFTDRPADWDDPKTAKILIVMSDGETITERKVRSSCSLPDWWTNTNDRYYIPNKVWVHTNTGFCTDTKTSSTDANTRFEQMCEAAENRGITVFTIMFGPDVDSTARSLLSDCATGPANFFAVTDDLSTAFDAIAARIQALKLVAS